MSVYAGTRAHARVCMERLQVHLLLCLITEEGSLIQSVLLSSLLQESPASAF